MHPSWSIFWWSMTFFISCSENNHSGIITYASVRFFFFFGSMTYGQKIRRFFIPCLPRWWCSFVIYFSFGAENLRAHPWQWWRVSKTPKLSVEFVHSTVDWQILNFWIGSCFWVGESFENVQGLENWRDEITASVNIT